MPHGIRDAGQQNSHSLGYVSKNVFEPSVTPIWIEIAYDQMLEVGPFEIFKKTRCISAPMFDIEIATSGFLATKKRI